MKNKPIAETGRAGIQDYEMLRIRHSLQNLLKMAASLWALRTDRMRMEFEKVTEDGWIFLHFFQLQRAVKPTAHLQLVPTLRKRGSIHRLHHIALWLSA
jgi:hypothetical protein